MLFCISINGLSQSRFVNSNDAHFYNWFHNQAQINELYTPGSSLIVFSDEALIMASASTSAEVVTRVTLGAFLRSESDYRTQLVVPQAEINGYTDNWYEVSGDDDAGRPFRGFIWGGNLAKGWRKIRLTGAQKEDLVLLGVSQKKRAEFTDIKADIRVLQGRQLVSQTTLQGLCVFEECQSTPLLRTVKSPVPGEMMIEASTMTVGCLSGIERAFLYWDGARLQCVYHAEYSVKKQYVNKPFQLKSGASTVVCKYNGLDKNYDPVWDVKPAGKATLAAKPKA